MYAVNTAGAIVGTVIAGFVLIPTLGAHSATKLGIIVNLLLAAGSPRGIAPAVPAARWGACAAAVVLILGVSAPPRGTSE